MAWRDLALVRGLVAVDAGGPGPDGVMRKCAERTEPFTVIFPGMGRVHFVATPEGAREILTLPREVLCAPTPNPIEPIVGPSSVILTSGEQHRRQRRLLSPAFRGAQMRRRARTMAEAVVEDTARWRRGERIALHHTSQAITKRIIEDALSVGRHIGDASDASRRAHCAAQAFGAPARRRAALSSR